MTLQVILTNSLRVKQSLLLDLRLICQIDEETFSHLLRDFIYSKQIWRSISGHKAYGNFYNLRFNDWLLYNLKSKCQIQGNSSASLFGISMDAIWQDRNAKVFKQIKPNCIAYVMRIRRIVHQLESSNLNSLGDNQFSLGAEVGEITKGWFGRVVENEMEEKYLN